MEMRNTRAPTVEELDKWVADVLDGRINTEADDKDFDLHYDDDDEDDGIFLSLHLIYISLILYIQKFKLFLNDKKF